MVELTGLFHRFEKRRILVVGDLMLDAYTHGKVSRISPEAPISVLKVNHQHYRPGGAGNVILNLLALGMEVRALGQVGDDRFGKTLLKHLKQEGVDTSGIFLVPNQETIVKNRIIAGNQQLLRIDHENIQHLSSKYEEKILEKLDTCLEGVEAVAISDYAKGFLTRTLLHSLIDLANKKGIPTLIDPKGNDFTKYKGATLIKPNLGEAIAASAMDKSAPLEKISTKLLEETKSECLMVTRSEDGISCFEKGGSELHFPIQGKEIIDVTGAGDTVLAMVAAAWANQFSLSESARLANVAAGVAVEAFGCARVTLAQVAGRLLEMDSANKVFEEKHLFALQTALKGNRYTLLALEDSTVLTSKMFGAIHQLSHQGKQTLLVYLRDPEPDPVFIQILATLKEVSFIILKSQSLHHLCQTLDPQGVYTLAGGELIEEGAMA